jgi:hypothetical protein
MFSDLLQHVLERDDAKVLGQVRELVCEPVSLVGGNAVIHNDARTRLPARDNG